MNSIEWTKKALKQLRKLNQPDQKIIFINVKKLQDWPDCQNVKALKNFKYPYRLRVGNYRIFFDVLTSLEILKIEEVKRRDENTYS